MSRPDAAMDVTVQLPEPFSELATPLSLKREAHELSMSARGRSRPRPSTAPSFQPWALQPLDSEFNGLLPTASWQKPTLRRLPGGISPTFDSGHFTGQLQRPLDVTVGRLAAIPTPSSRVPDPDALVSEGPKDRPLSLPPPPCSTPGPLECPGFRRRDWPARVGHRPASVLRGGARPWYTLHCVPKPATR